MTILWCNKIECYIKNSFARNMAVAVIFYIQMEWPLYDSMSFSIFTGCTKTDMSGRQRFCFPDKKRNSPSHTCALFTTHSVKPELPSVYPSYRQKQVIRGSPVLYVIAVASTFQCTKLRRTLEIPIIRSCSIRIFHFLRMLFPYYSTARKKTEVSDPFCAL